MGIMTIPHESEGLHPNADVLRLREYAKVLSGISDIIEVIEEPEVKLDTLEFSYSFSVGSYDEYAIPISVIDAVGPIHKMDIQLRLMADTMHSGEPVAADYEVEPTPEKVFDRMISPPNPTLGVNEEPQIVESTGISLYLEGANATYAISRSSLEATHDTPDGILSKINGQTTLTDIGPISQADFNQLIMSIVAPASQASISGSQGYEGADFLKPGAFGILNELFQDVTFADQDYLGHRFKSSDTFFKYIHVLNSEEKQPTTSFRVRFNSNETGRPIILRSDLDTNFELSFETINDDTADGPALIPHTPTLSELEYFDSLLEKELLALQDAKASTDEAIDLGFDIEETENAIDKVDDAINDEQEFQLIAATETEAAYFDIVERFDKPPTEE